MTVLFMVLWCAVMKELLEQHQDGKFGVRQKDLRTTCSRIFVRGTFATPELVSKSWVAIPSRSLASGGFSPQLSG